ncbi:MAG: TIGR00266 family protein [Pirellulaceae bacterium]
METISCTYCQAQYRIAPENVGKQVRCQKCGDVFVANAPSTQEPPPIMAVDSNTRIADEIDYQIFGDDMQYAEIVLDPGEAVIAEAGAMMYMSSGIQMETVFGDPSRKGDNFWNKMMSAGKRVLTGESLFMTVFSNTAGGRESVAFGAPYPGRIEALHLDQLGGEIVAQRDSFLCGAKGIEISIAFQKKIGVGLLGGEGFIMQKLRGDGIALIHACGTMMHRELSAGETLRVDTGCIVALGPSVNYDIQFNNSIKSAMFGGEGLVFATLTGPGPIWLQSLPFARLARRFTAGATSGKEQGSLLDLGGIGGMLMGDND